MSKEIKSILFVCTGNSCRSAMAEGLLKKALSDKNRTDITVNSCGTIAISGYPPTANTVQVMKNKGIDVSKHETSPLNKEIINKSDLILVMESLHKKEVIELVPEAKNKVHLLREFVKTGNKEEYYSVPDPIGRPLEVYERILGMIREAVQKLVEKI